MISFSWFFMFIAFIVYMIGSNYMIDKHILNMDRIQCNSRDHEAYLFQLNNIKLDKETNYSMNRIKYNIESNFIIECYKHNSKYIKKNMMNIFNIVLEKSNIIINRNYSYLEDKGYISLVKIIKEIGKNDNDDD